MLPGISTRLPTTLLDTLNPTQRQAAETLDNAVLVLAGAGTGKTRVLTMRIAHILDQQLAWPSQILAVTFTNRASQEMKQRIGNILTQPVDGLWLGTFHSICVRILRRHAEQIARTPDFTILDADDQIRLIKQIMRTENIDEKAWPPRMVAAVISRWKDKGLTPDKVNSADIENTKAENPILMIYKIYQDQLNLLNALDFGDLLLATIQLFSNYPEILKGYHNQFKYILVDEYQDTNVAQYLWMRLLAQGGANVCCVGDDDQAIYGWRGAEVTNILRFEKDFPGATIVRLEQNYRSTPHILGAASGLITYNKGRLGKTLWTELDQGEKVTVCGTWDGEEEARVVGEEIEALQRQKDSLASMAVLVRAGFQTREFEERFITMGIPYRVVGGARFYERLEIRDAIAYLRIVAQPSDSLAFERIINTPRRGIGLTTIKVLHEYSRMEQIPLIESARRLIETDEIRGKARTALSQLLQDIDRWRGNKDNLKASALAQVVLDESGYTAMWKTDKSAEAPGRLDNLKEFVRALDDFEDLAEFLEHVSLVMENNVNNSLESVTLMTLHSAKGLEFDNVFLAGWEEGLFPNPRNLDDNGTAGLEEERRLAYVGLTRARQHAYITFATNRRIHGAWQSSVPSRFLEELPKEHLKIQSQKGVFGSASFKRRPDAVLSNQPVAEINPLLRGNEYKKGDRIFHQKFGYGIIHHSDSDKLEIIFDHTGLKRVMASFVKRADEL